MKRLLPFLVLVAVLPASAAGQTHHNIMVTLDPERGWIEVTDTVTMVVADRSAPISFLLAKSLGAVELASRDPIDWQVDDEPKPTDFFPDPDSSDVELVGRAQAIVLELEGDTWPERLRVEFRYNGVIYDTLRAPSKAYSKGFATTTGLIDTAGVFLAGISLWLPTLVDDMFTFDLHVDAPPGWETVSQGERRDLLGDEPRFAPGSKIWHCPHPMEECYLVAGRYHVESRTFGSVEALTYLYQADRELSERYLSATERYLAMYRELIGPYPFKKFALVENFWQTGYGMPSFTLLGNRVIRLPFIVHTSYGHEILHNWWGNGVYVDYGSGNWCEGLTVYGADYLYKEMAGADQARQYRLETLANYLNFVKTGDEIPLSEFHERHSASTQAVGYGKAMMLFHMLRRKMGHDLFWRSLRTFYQTNLFEEASWEDLREAFEETTGLDLADYFETWVNRVGAPMLSISLPEVFRTRAGYRFRGEIHQTIPTYDLDVPVSLETAEGETTWTVSVVDTVTLVEINVASRPTRFAADPDFEIFRLIRREEVPPTIGELLGADTTLIVLPADPGAGHGAFADEWAERGRVHVVHDPILPEQLPTSGAVVFFEIADAPAEVVSAATGWEVQGQLIQKEGRTLIFTTRDSEDLEVSYTWIDAGDPSCLTTLTRKLPHYGKYSFLVFDDASGRVIEKGIWRSAESPMIVELTSATDEASGE